MKERGFISVSEKGRIFAFCKDDKYFLQSSYNHEEFSPPKMITEEDFENIVKNPGKALYNNSN